jgi:hypothetical protein
VFVNLLDVALHQPQFVRQTSAILFTTILAIASRYRRPTLYAHLRKLVNGMLGRAFAEGVVELGLVQSLSLLSFWKEADDRGTWRRVGYAIRIALEMDLHQPSQEPLPDNEIEARKVLVRIFLLGLLRFFVVRKADKILSLVQNCERTFIQLIAFDNTLFLQSTRPRQPFLAFPIFAFITDSPMHSLLAGMIPPEYVRAQRPPDLDIGLLSLTVAPSTVLRRLDTSSVGALTIPLSLRSPTQCWPLRSTTRAFSREWPLQV